MAGIGSNGLMEYIEFGIPLNEIRDTVTAEGGICAYGKCVPFWDYCTKYINSTILRSPYFIESFKNLRQHSNVLEYIKE
ncbi:MAG: hypothetical protein KDH96_00325 [Candidatus Riesia sp.]|nr:hypothetical protein [Candidatus Riesia sp.]